LRELADQIEALPEKKLLVGEDERNDPASITTLGLDALWADDFHHQVRVTLTGEQHAYYAAFQPGAGGLADTINRGWLYEGQYYLPKGEPRGKSARDLAASALVYCIQNHDQIGNRPFGDRLTSKASLDAYCAASMLLLFLPMTPLLFMGQEWAASSPFLYFTDHDETLGHLISEGRRREFAGFRDPETDAEVPDPQALDTFTRSQLRWEERTLPEHARVLDLYQKLLSLRRTDPVLRDVRRETTKAEAQGDVLTVRRRSGIDERWLLVNCSPKPVQRGQFSPPEKDCSIVLSSAPLGGGVLPAWTAVCLATTDGASPNR
jgi:maltooligosyltrehalose trehalohydrolase